MIGYDDPCDRPYGPTNPDYEYDAERQRNDEEETEIAMKRYIAIAIVAILQGCAAPAVQDSQSPPQSKGTMTQAPGEVPPEVTREQMQEHCANRFWSWTFNCLVFRQLEQSK